MDLKEKENTPKPEIVSDVYPTQSEGEKTTGQLGKTCRLKDKQFFRKQQKTVGE